MTEVIFDPRRTSFEDLARWAKKRDCAQPIIARTDEQLAIARSIGEVEAKRSDAAIRDVKDDKYHLGRTPMRFLPLTQLQRTRINADRKTSERWLSPRQRAWLRLIDENPDAGWKPASGQDILADHAKVRRTLDQLIAAQR